MWLPKWLYELLPYLHLFMGGQALTLQEVYGRISGVMLLVAACLIIKIRYQHRRVRA
jgi:hypothetical protein